MNELKRYQQAKRVTLIGAICNAILGIVKIIFGGLGHSHALLADGIHSLSDLLTDALVLIASKYGSQAADDDHPYGHQRIETAATCFLSLLLVVVGVAIFYDGLKHIFSALPEELGIDILVVAFASIVINEALFHYTRYYGNRLKSKLLVANAWHHRSDAASSLVVFLGVVGSLFGFKFFDPMAASIVGILVIKMGWQLGWSSISELVDTSVDAKVLKDIHQIIETTPGVVELHQLRTRLMGGAILIDVHVLVDSHLSVSEGHFIGQNVALNLRRQVKLIQDVTVHIDPEDDEIANPSIHLAPRDELEDKIKNACVSLTGFDSLQNITIHYLDGQILIDLFFQAKRIDSKGIQQAVMAFNHVSQVKLYQEVMI